METVVPDELLTVKDVAGKMKLTPGAVRQMARDGGLPAMKVGSDWRFDWTQVVGYLRSVASNQRPEAVQA